MYVLHSVPTSFFLYLGCITNIGVMNQEFSVHTTLNELKALPSGIRQLSRLFAESRTRQSGLESTNYRDACTSMWCETFFRSKPCSMLWYILYCESNTRQYMCAIPTTKTRKRRASIKGISTGWGRDFSLCETNRKTGHRLTRYFTSENRINQDAFGAWPHL